MNTPETINIEKYINALNNLIGSDNAYYAGDPDVDAIVEVIVTAKKLEDRVKKLTEENEHHRKTIAQNAQSALEVTLEEVHQVKIDTIREIQSKLIDASEFALRADSNGSMYYVDYAAWVEKVTREILEEEL